MINVPVIKKGFPIFQYQPSLIYLDSAATSLKPKVVIDTEREYLEQYSSNVGRGLYPLAEKATEKFEAVREKVAHYIKATSSREIIFTSGTTDSINLAANLLAHTIESGDNIVTTIMEHHSNFLPWKELARQKNAELRVINITKEGELDMEMLKKSIDARTKIMAFTAVSNVLGTINPVAEIIATIKNINPQTLVLVDVAQAVGSLDIDVAKWSADFVAFSAHKMFGPTGVGVLYGKSDILEELNPVIFGGGMVLDIYPTGRVNTSEIMYKEIPYRFEAGTPNIGGVIAFGAALDYIENLGWKNIRAHEKNLAGYAMKLLKETFGNTINILGPSNQERRAGIIAFAFANIHPHDIAHLLGEENVCVRAGNHCASPLHQTLNLNATTRISFSIYNSKKDVEKFIETLQKVQQKLKIL
jgi:cysteine desulfurase / selenocysteine lyase